MRTSSINAARAARGQSFESPPPETAHGALLAYLGSANAKSFQPTNVNYGLFPPLPHSSLECVEAVAYATEPGRRRGHRKLPKRERNQRMASRALASLRPYAERTAPDAG